MSMVEDEGVNMENLRLLANRLNMVLEEALVHAWTGRLKDLTNALDILVEKGEGGKSDQPILGTVIAYVACLKHAISTLTTSLISHYKGTGIACIARLEVRHH
jgi:hypothetical protein